MDLKLVHEMVEICFSLYHPTDCKKSVFKVARHFVLDGFGDVFASQLLKLVERCPQLRVAPVHANKAKR